MVKDAQLWIHTQLNATLVFYVMLFLFFTMMLVTNIHRSIQWPCAPATYIV